jgi:diguanylate cyclase (GGDEF)-like protein
MLRIKALTDALERATRRLSELADTDGLTGIPNRRSFEDLYATEFERARRYHRPLAVLLVDVDHFKRVNDTHGHPAGDVALRAVAETLVAALRTCDRVARYGGEEFAVIAPETPPEGGRLLGERLRTRVESTEVPGPAGPLRLTISVGAAGWPGNGEPNRAALLKAADEALYAAKSAGRNRVILAR